MIFANIMKIAVIFSTKEIDVIWQITCRVVGVDKRVDLRVRGIQKPHGRNEIFKFYAKRITSRI